MRDFLKHKLCGRLQSLWLTERQRLLEILCAEYTSETQMEMRFRQHAERMHYPQFRDRLLRIATDEERHAGWLREKISAFQGRLPEVAFTETTGKNTWECLLIDLEEERRCVADLEDRLLKVEKIDPEIALGLRQIQEEEKHHRDEIRDMLMRSDAYALWPE